MVDNGVTVTTLDGNGETIQIPAGRIKITVDPRRPGIANVLLEQDQGGGNTTTLLNKNFEVLAALPVVWTRPLNVNTVANQSEFTWGVSDQEDVAGYTLERQEGNTFVPVQEVAYIENGSAEVIYGTTAPLPTTDSYYRIRQTDFDGTFSLSNTVFVPGSREVPLRLFPNPATDYIQFAGVGQELTAVKIFNATGRLVRDFPLLELDSGRIPVRDLPPGLYVVTAYGAAGRLATDRVVVR